MNEPTALETLLSTVATVLTSFLSWLGSVTTALISNPFIALMFGMGIALVIYRLVVGLVGKASFRKSKKRR